MGPIALQAVSPSDLARALDCELGEARKIVSAVHRDRSIDGPLVGVRRVVMDRARAMTVCTSGLPSGIRRLAKEAPKVRLAMSIGSARTAVRRSLMPIDKAHPLAEVIDAAVEHARATSQSPLWAVTPLAGVNDSA